MKSYKDRRKVYASFERELFYRFSEYLKALDDANIDGSKDVHAIALEALVLTYRSYSSATVDLEKMMGQFKGDNVRPMMPHDWFTKNKGAKFTVIKGGKNDNKKQ